MPTGTDYQDDTTCSIQSVVYHLCPVHIADKVITSSLLRNPHQRIKSAARSVYTVHLRLALAIIKQ